MSGLRHEERVPLPTKIDWDVLIAADRFIEECEPRTVSRSVELSGVGFKYEKDDVTLDQALTDIGDRRSDVRDVLILVSKGPNLRSVVFERAGVKVFIAVGPYEGDTNLRVGGADEVTVRGIAQTFRQRFLVESGADRRWRDQPAAVEAPASDASDGVSSVSWWGHISTHPLYSAIIAGLVVAAVIAIFVLTF